MRMQNTDNLTPRDRVDGMLLRQILAEEAGGYVPVSAQTTPGTMRRPMPSLAMVYSPEQPFTDLYEPEKGLTRGTIFSQLDLPLCPQSCMARR